MLVADDDDFALEEQDAPDDAPDEEQEAAPLETIDASADDELAAPSEGIAEFELLPLVLRAMEAVQRGEGAEALGARVGAVRRRIARCELIVQRHAEQVGHGGAVRPAHAAATAAGAAAAAADAPALPEARGTAAAAGADAPAAEAVGRKRRMLPS